MKFWKPTVGQRVRLTGEGYKSVKPQSRVECMVALHGMTVIDVSEAGTTPECWNVDVDGPFSHLLLTSADVEAI